MSPSTGKLIVIEGLEGAGKSTALHVIMDFLAQQNIQILSTREPGGTDIGEQIRTIIKNPEYKDILDPKSELLLIYTARMQLIEQVIKPALQQGFWVIADRFELSTKAYQGGGREVDPNMIQNLSDFCLQGFKPDLTVYLDIDPEQGMSRVHSRGALDRIELQSIDFFHRVHKAYMHYIQNDPRACIIDARLSLDEVKQAIHNGLLQFIDQQL